MRGLPVRVATYPDRMNESEMERVAEAQRRAAEIVRGSERTLSVATPSLAVSDAIRSLDKLPQPSPAITDAIRNLGKLNLGNTTALAEAAKGFASLRPLMGPEVGEALQNLRSPLLAPEVAAAFQAQRQIVPRLPKGLLDTHFADVVQPRLAEALKEWQVSPLLIRNLTDAMRNAGVVPWLDIGPLVGEAVRRAAVVAEDPAAAEVASEAVESFDLDAASPEKRRELQANIVGAIGMLATAGAFFVHSRNLEFAAILFGLLAYLVAISGEIGDE
jgi:hypothetical protein